MSDPEPVSGPWLTDPDPVSGFWPYPPAPTGIPIPATSTDVLAERQTQRGLERLIAAGDEDEIRRARDSGW